MNGATVRPKRPKATYYICVRTPPDAYPLYWQDRKWKTPEEVDESRDAMLMGFARTMASARRAARKAWGHPVEILRRDRKTGSVKVFTLTGRTRK